MSPTSSDRPAYTGTLSNPGRSPRPDLAVVERAMRCRNAAPATGAGGEAGGDSGSHPGVKKSWTAGVRGITCAPSNRLMPTRTAVCRPQLRATSASRLRMSEDASSPRPARAGVHCISTACPSDWEVQIVELVVAEAGDEFPGIASPLPAACDSPMCTRDWPKPRRTPSAQLAPATEPATHGEFSLPGCVPKFRNRLLIVEQLHVANLRSRNCGAMK